MQLRAHQGLGFHHQVGRPATDVPVEQGFPRRRRTGKIHPQRQHRTRHRRMAFKATSRGGRYRAVGHGQANTPHTRQPGQAGRELLQ